ncbi:MULTISPECIES: DEAD/DEAH box helicase family protein [unclassified Luteococcus]|uniref:DEAD/DEAH box helicase family protein n=1 Tax=unclassified Luteococcus TaxID=2639923 RepID=UPI00313B885C
MGNFDFLRGDWPDIAGNAARAEEAMATDPLITCVYARRTVELLVQEIYALNRLPEAYRPELSAQMNAGPFRTIVPTPITDKLNLIRRYGNDAAHPGTRTLRPADGQACLEELFHVLVWFGLNYTTTPNQVPVGQRFDPEVARRKASVPRTQVAQLVRQFKLKDQQAAQQLEGNASALASLEAELEATRQQLAAAKTQHAVADTHDYTEAITRARFIDLQLREAGWPLDQARDREFEVHGMPNNSGVGYVDYVLWGDDGLPLAVVEAKRTQASELKGQQQATLYADCMAQRFGRRPVIFYTNGIRTWLWDDAAGYPPREIQGFLTKDQLELTIQRRAGRKQLALEPVDPEIAGRYYQSRAIKAIGQSFDQRHREALLVMATGSGKTRTVIALVKQLMDAGWVKRVLFLADRTALVGQAARAFRAHLPNVTTVDLVKERAAEGRVYCSTYPTILNLINQTDDADERRFGPGHFDLVVIDEAHRSVYDKYGAIFRYFDSLLVGLTATPKDEVDHNTYRLFHLEDGVPTDAYSLDEAVRDGYLVPPKGIAVGTKFTRLGIKYNELTEAEKEQWDSLDWGEDGAPDEVGAEELNRFLFNEDTVDKVLGQLMADGYRVAGNDRLAKTIIFAKNQQHADFIQQRFDLGWPQHAGQFARVITHANPYAQSLIDDFSDAAKNPQIAISVDMLDTGIDVPEVANLVFFKMVRSKSKFWQMIGRGTRLCPDLFGPGKDKRDFYVFDYCGNLEFFGQDFPGSEGSTQKSLTQRIFEARMELIRALASQAAEEDLRKATAATLHEFVAGMTFDNVLVRPHWETVEKFNERSRWENLTPDGIREAIILAGLPTTAEVEKAAEKAKRFDLLILRRQVAQLEGDAVLAERIRGQVQEMCTMLLGKTNIPMVAEQQVLIEAVASDDWWADVTPSMLELARTRLRGLMHLIENTPRTRVFTDFEDTLGIAVEVDLPGITPGTDLERFRAKARSYLRTHESHISMQRLLRNKPLTTDDLAALEEMLLDAGGTHDVVDTAGQAAGGLGLFVRSLVGLDRGAATEAFSRFLDGTRYSVNQVRFVQLIVDELTSNGLVEPRRLFEAPFTDTAPTGPEHVFQPQEVDDIVAILRDVKRRAQPASPPGGNPVSA